MMIPRGSEGPCDVAAAVNTLRARGHRLSSARRVLLEALYGADGPISAKEIARGVEGRLPPSDLASVYRNLERLEALGLVRHVHIGRGPGRYLPAEVRWEFVVCEDCGDVTAVEPDLLDRARDAIRAATGYAVGFAHFPVVGTCPSCSDSVAGATSSQKALICRENYASAPAADANIRAVHTRPQEDPCASSTPSRRPR
jgi:Fur family ferric uptake transcriptional regulator